MTRALTATAIAVIVCALLFALAKTSRGDDEQIVSRTEGVGRPEDGGLSNVSMAPVERHNVNLDGADALDQVGVASVAVPKYTPNPLSEKAQRNIAERTREISIFMAFLSGEKELPSDLTYGSVARSAAELSVLVIFDATQRSEFYALPGETTLETAKRVASEGGNRWYLDAGAAYRIVSGGANYEVPIGEFRAYDTILTLNEEFGGNTPIGELPIEALESLTLHALGYSPR